MNTFSLGVIYMKKSSNFVFSQVMGLGEKCTISMFYYIQYILKKLMFDVLFYTV